MTVTASQLGTLVPDGGWPEWVFVTPYVVAAHPHAVPVLPIGAGANCQRFAYAVLHLFGNGVPPHRSSELWEDPELEHVLPAQVRDLDLVLFNPNAGPWGAHVAVTLGAGMLHLNAEVGRPAFWQWSDFAERERYRTIVGVIRARR